MKDPRQKADEIVDKAVPKRCEYMLSRGRRCPAPVFPGSDYCPLHTVMVARMKKRMDNSLLMRVKRLADRGIFLDE